MNPKDKKNDPNNEESETEKKERERQEEWAHITDHIMADMAAIVEEIQRSSLQAPLNPVYRFDLPSMLANEADFASRVQLAAQANEVIPDAGNLLLAAGYYGMEAASRALISYDRALVVARDPHGRTAADLAQINRAPVQLVEFLTDHECNFLLDSDPDVPSEVSASC